MSLDLLATELNEKIGDHASIPAKLKLDFGPENGCLFIDGTVSPVEIREDDAAADCTIKISRDNFDALMQGDLNPQMAFMTGKLKIDGDMSIAMQLAGLLS